MRMKLTLPAPRNVPAARAPQFFRCSRQLASIFVEGKHAQSVDVQDPVRRARKSAIRGKLTARQMGISILPAHSACGPILA